MTDIIKIAENRLDTLSDDLIIRGLVNEVKTLREKLREIYGGETIYFITLNNGERTMLFSTSKPNGSYAKFVRVE